MIKIESTTETIESKGGRRVAPCRKNSGEGGAGADKEQVCEKCRSRHHQPVRAYDGREERFIMHPRLIFSECIGK